MNPGNEVVLWKDEALGITYYVREGGKKPVIRVGTIGSDGSLLLADLVSSSLSRI